MGNSSLKILVVEDDGFTRALVGDSLRGLNHEVTDVASVSAAMQSLARTDFNVVITDLDLGHGPSGADLLERINEDQPWMGMVALTSHSSPELAIGRGTQIPPSTIYLVKSELKDVKGLEGAIADSLSGAPQPASQKAAAASDARMVVTRSQADVLRMLAQGLATARIAESRKTSVRATEMMVQRLYEKLGLKASADRDPRISAVIMWQQGRVRVH
jgi:DNA-binding NarL/FixJ family response regulator